MDESEKKNFMKKYLELQSQLNDIENFFSSDAPKNLSSKILSDYQTLQRVSRANYVKIFAFDKYYPLPLTEEQLIESFVRNDVKMISLASSPTVFQAASNCIKSIYQKPNLSQILANYTYSFFQSQPEDLPIFAYITFPSLYGFFITLDHLQHAYDFTSTLLHIKVEFFLPFFVSYLTSANVFVEIFWHQFFGLVDLKDRLKPSIAQLYEFLFQAFEYSVSYLNSYHIMLCSEFLVTDPSLFFDCFFKRFLLSTFKAWASYNPAVSSSKVTEEDLEALFAFIVENANGIFYRDFNDILSRNSYTINQLDSFVENTNEPNITYLLSPRELKIISQLFLQIPELSKVIFDYRNFKDINYNSFVAGSFDVYHDNKKKKQNNNNNKPKDMANNENEKNEDEDKDKNDFSFLIYDNKESKFENAKQQIKELDGLDIESVDKSKKEEIERSWNTIQQICKFDFCVDPFKTLMTCEIIDDNDNIYEKLAKKKIRKMSNPSLKKYALGLLHKSVMDKQICFEAYWTKQTFAKTVNDAKLKLIRYGEIMEELILPKFHNKNSLFNPKAFATNLVRIDMVETEDFSKPNLIDCQNIFFESLKHYKNQNPKFSSFLSLRDSFFSPLVLTLEKTDELSLGDRFFLLYNVYSQITILTMPVGREKIFDDPLSSLNALFAHLIVRADFRSFIRTYINVCAYKKKNLEKFQMLPQEMIEKWNAIQTFVISVIQDEDFDPQSRLTILTFTQ